MNRGGALVAIYLTVLGLFVALVLQLVGIALTLVIVGFVVFVLSLLLDTPELSAANRESPSESPSETRSRWR
ncbi:hypothetical protein [Halovenus halobia]|uniref:hypothetical protein n=1 Tax=Halovenus halobia TaxID=3396622 RepID=UPI003F55A125